MTRAIDLFTPFDGIDSPYLYREWAISRALAGRIISSAIVELPLQFTTGMSMMIGTSASPGLRRVDMARAATWDRLEEVLRG